MSYIELTTRSNFSFLQGGTSPERLVFEARTLGYETLALTDRNGLYGIVRAYEEAKKHDMRIIVGAELTVSCAGRLSKLVVHVENHVGYTNRCHILTECHKNNPK